MNNKREEEAMELQKAIEEFLAKGGEITVCESGARTENINMTGKRMWGRKKAAAAADAKPKKAVKKKSAK